MNDRLVEAVTTRFHQVLGLGERRLTPRKEVARKISESKPELDLMQIRQEILESARERIPDIKDSRKIVGASIVVVGFSLEDGDVNSALSLIDYNDEVREEGLAALARVLAETKRLDRAREIVSHITSNYWKAEAFLCIACVSRSDDDFKAANESAGKISADDFIGTVDPEVDAGVYASEMKEHLLEDVQYIRSHIVPSSMPTDLDFQHRSRPVSQIVETLITNDSLIDVINQALAIEDAYDAVNVLAIISEALEDLMA